MAALVLGILAFIVLEIVTAVWVVSTFQWLGALLFLVVAGAVGAWMVKREGLAAWTRVVSGVRLGEMPTEALVDGGIVVAAGFLLLLPGFVSDVLAILLVVPPIRKLVRTRVLAASERRIASGAGRSRVSFGFGSTGFGGGFGTGAFGGFGDARGPIADPDIIDLDAEEVVIDEPRGELGGPGSAPR